MQITLFATLLFITSPQSLYHKCASDCVISVSIESSPETSSTILFILSGTLLFILSTKQRDITMQYNTAHQLHTATQSSIQTKQLKIETTHNCMYDRNFLLHVIAFLLNSSLLLSPNAKSSPVVSTLVSFINCCTTSCC